MLPQMHFAVGMAISKILPPYFSIPLSFISHYNCDLYPESDKFELMFKQKWDRPFVLAVSFQILVLFLLVFALINDFSLWHIACGFSACLPDIIETFSKKVIFLCHEPGYQKFCMEPYQNSILDVMFVLFILY